MAIAAVAATTRNRAVPRKSNDRGQIDTLSRWLPILMYADPGRVPTRDLPSARPYRQAPSNRTYVWSNVGYIGFDQMMGAPGQVLEYDTPRAFDRPRSTVHGRTWIQALVHILPSSQMYGDIGESPAWALPAARPYRQAPANRTFTLTTVNFIGQDTMMGAPGQVMDYDLPNARPAKQAPQNRTYLWNNTGYIGQDQLWGAPGMAPDYDTPRAFDRPEP
jgi:hypothetical protein